MTTWIDIIIEAAKEFDNIIIDNNHEHRRRVLTIAKEKGKHPRENFRITVHLCKYVDNNYHLHDSPHKYFTRIRKNTYLLISAKKIKMQKNLANSVKEESKEIEGQIIKYREQKLSEIEIFILVKARMGQGKFRDGLYERWKGCSVTGYEYKDMLIASHIQPWSESKPEEKTDLENGFLLTANLDKAFDRGLITFKDNGDILISENFKNPKGVNIKEGMKIRNLSQGNLKYLKIHRKKYNFE